MTASNESFPFCCFTRSHFLHDYFSVYCKQIEDVSQLSLGGNTEHDDKGDLIGSPPLSPLFTSEGPSGGTAGNTAGQAKGKQTTIHPTKIGQQLFKKYQDSSLDADETESELVAIPESDLSDSTMHGSSAPVCQYLRSDVYS